MSRKGRARKWKLPTPTGSAIWNGAGGRALPASDTDEHSATPAQLRGMVETTSSPHRAAPSEGESPLNGAETPNGEADPALPTSVAGGAGASRTKHLDAARIESSPQPVRPRPEAPPLHFSSPPPPVESADSLECDARRDDMSVPPVDLDNDFFAAQAALAEASFEVDARDPRAAMKRTATAARRRAHLAKYVTGAVGLASTLCVAALFKIAVAPNQGDFRSQHSSSTAQAAGLAPPALNVAATTESAPSPALAANSVPADRAFVPEGTPPIADQAAQAKATADPGTGPAPQGAAEPKAPEPVDPMAASALGAPAAPTDAPQPKPDEAPVDPRAAAKEAAKEKVKSRNAIEWGKVADSIAAGERSVAIDPTDAEAWLILGAAYQQKGDSKNAVRSFRACVEQSKRGPRYECAAMLRSR